MITPHFVGTCVGLPSRHLDAYDDSSRDITYRTFLKHLGSEVVREFERDLGYGRHLRLKDDYHVSYSIGKWRGQKAVCCEWSSIHHIWTVSAGKIF